MFISPAYAQAAGGGGGDPFMTFLPIILIFVVFYFLLIRPQQKKVKQHRQMVSAIRRGDKIVTAGGLIGTVRSEEHTSELQSLMRISYAVFCLKKKNTKERITP